MRIPIPRIPPLATLTALACLLLPAALGQDAQPSSEEGKVVVLDEIVAKVNNEIITLSDLQRDVKDLRTALERQVQDPAQFQTEFERQKKDLLRNMIQSRMMIQKAEELGVTANVDVDVSAYLEELRKENGIPNMEVFDQALRQQGSSLVQFRQNLKEKYIQDSLIQQFVYSKITLLTPEIEAFYKENIDRFTEPAEVELAEILFLTEGKDKAQVRRKAEEALAKLKGGTSFDEVAKQYSEGPTGSKGGLIGSFKKGSLAEQLDKVVFDLAEGETTGIVETEFGLQIVRVIKREAAKQKPLEEVRPQISQFLYARKAQPEMKEFMEELREQSYIFVAPKYQQEFDVEELVGAPPGS